MPRKKLIRSTIHPYHVTARCNNKEAFSAPLDLVWQIILLELNVIVQKFGCKVHAFVLMPNHFHLLITTEVEDLGVVMQNFMISITKKINRVSMRTGRVFGARYHWSLIDNDHYYDCALKYVYRNPVKAGLTQLVEEYEFSTIGSLFDKRRELIPLSPLYGFVEITPHGGFETYLKWLNEPFPNEQNEAIQKAFQKTKFKLPKPNWDRKSIDFER
jgi:putative transposase